MATNRKTFYRRVLPEICIAFASERGKELFKDALPTGYLNCYFCLASQFRTQEEPAYCGLSSLVMVLNTLAIDPGVVWKGVFRWYHEDMLDCCSSLGEVKEKGISMNNLMCLAMCNQLDGQMRRVTEKSCINRFREEVKVATSREDRAIIVSYGRQVLGQTGSGHFSPIGGYNVTEDMVLILDVARFKYPPYWVPLSEIWKAMNTIDQDSGLHRGYMILWRADSAGTGVPSQPPLIFKITKHISTTTPIISKCSDFFLEMKSFLRGKIKEETEDETLKAVAVAFLEESFKYAQNDIDNRPSFLTLRVTEEQLHSYLPEELEVVKELIQAINDTVLCKKISKIFPKGVCCRQALFVAQGKKDSEICTENSDVKPEGDCMICLQHFLTVFFLSFPMNGLACSHSCHGRTVIKEDFIPEAEEQNTYYGFLKQLIDAEIGPKKCCGDAKSGQLKHALLINEVTQLRRQFSVLLEGKVSQTAH